MSFYKFLTDNIVLGFLLFFIGCTTIKMEYTNIVQLKEADLINLSVELQLTQNFRNTECVREEGGWTFITPLGKNLSINAEEMTKKVFRRVKTTHMLTSGQVEDPSIQAVLVPKVDFLNQDRPFSAFSIQTMSMNLVWTLLDTGGNIIWTTTINAEGKGHMQPIYGEKLNTEQVDNLMRNVFEDSFNRILSSKEIQEYARKINGA